MRGGGVGKRRWNTLFGNVFFLVIFLFCWHQHARYLSVLPSGNPYVYDDPTATTDDPIRSNKILVPTIRFYVGVARDALTDVRSDPEFMLSHFRPFSLFLPPPTSISGFPAMPHSRRHGMRDKQMTKRAMKIYKRTIYPRPPFSIKIYSHERADKTQNALYGITAVRYTDEITCELRPFG